jgi:phosphatidylglycerophosphate synthase
METNLNRRPLESRSKRWAVALASACVRARLSPNGISVVSTVFAGAGAALLVRRPSGLPLLAVAACVQLRLLCNMLDGMVAIEGGRRTPTGGLYNELPDRIADSALIVALGYACGVEWLGWAGALAAALTAYIRALGGSFGLAQDFRGPLAKPHRMFVLTLACLGAAWCEPELARKVLLGTAWVIAGGSVLTCFTRTWALSRALHARGDA